MGASAPLPGLHTHSHSCRCPCPRQTTLPAWPPQVDRWALAALFLAYNLAAELIFVLQVGSRATCRCTCQMQCSTYLPAGKGSLAALPGPSDAAANVGWAVRRCFSLRHAPQSGKFGRHQAPHCLAVEGLTDICHAQLLAPWCSRVTSTCLAEQDGAGAARMDHHDHGSELCCCCCCRAGSTGLGAAAEPDGGRYCAPQRWHARLWHHCPSTHACTGIVWLLRALQVGLTESKDSCRALTRARAQSCWGSNGI